jgi:hypothetical protein
VRGRERTPFTASVNLATSTPHSVLRRATGEIEHDLPLDALRAAFEQPAGGTLWVDLDVSDADQAALLKDLFQSSPSRMRATRAAASRPRSTRASSSSSRAW